jgi:hypothetical protein
VIHDPFNGHAIGVDCDFCFGQSIIQSIGATAGRRYLALFDNTDMSQIAGGATIGLYVDNSDGGKLKAHVSGAPSVRIAFWVVTIGIHANSNT